MSIGTHMRNYRERLGFSIQDAAERASISPDLWDKFEADRARPTIAALLPIAAALEVPLTELTAPNPLRVRAEVATRIAADRMPNTAGAKQQTEAVRQRLLRLLDIDASLRAEGIGIHP